MTGKVQPTLQQKIYPQAVGAISLFSTLQGVCNGAWLRHLRAHGRGRPINPHTLPQHAVHTVLKCLLSLPQILIGLRFNLRPLKKAAQHFSVSLAINKVY